MEERGEKRVPFHIHAVINFNNTELSGEVENLSTGGMLIRTGEKAPVDSVVEITVKLTGTTTKLKLNLLGRVIRSDGKGIALHFLELDLDAYIHLKNIVAYNSTDNGAILREFENARVDTSVHD